MARPWSTSRSTKTSAPGSSAPTIGHDNSAVVGDLLAHPLVHVGASDGGAHVGSFSTFGDTGYLFSEFVRGTGSLSLEAAVKKITLDPATIWGLKGRGLLAAGHAADVVVFDADRIGRGPEVASDDFPGDGIRWIRRQEGVDTVVVNGEVTWTADAGYIATHARARSRPARRRTTGCRSRGLGQCAQRLVALAQRTADHREHIPNDSLERLLRCFGDRRLVHGDHRRSELRIDRRQFSGQPLAGGSHDPAATSASSVLATSRAAAMKTFSLGSRQPR